MPAALQTCRPAPTDRPGSSCASTTSPRPQRRQPPPGHCLPTKAPGSQPPARNPSANARAPNSRPLNLARAARPTTAPRRPASASPAVWPPAARTQPHAALIAVTRLSFETDALRNKNWGLNATSAAANAAAVPSLGQLAAHQVGKHHRDRAKHDRAAAPGAQKAQCRATARHPAPCSR